MRVCVGNRIEDRDIRRVSTVGLRKRSRRAVACMFWCFYASTQVDRGCCMLDLKWREAEITCLPVCEITGGTVVNVVQVFKSDLRRENGLIRRRNYLDRSCHMFQAVVTPILSNSRRAKRQPATEQALSWLGWVPLSMTLEAPVESTATVRSA